MLFAEPPVRENRYTALDVQDARCVADDNEAYFRFVQRIWQNHQIEAGRQTAAIVRRVMRQHRRVA